MKTKVNSVVELVRGGNTFKQGDEKEIVFVIKEDGQILDLDGATATITLANDETVVLERTASIVNDEIIVQFTNEDINTTGYGEMLLEIKIVKDELIRRFPADGFQQIRITPTLDNLEFKGVPFVTVETFVSRMDTFDQTLTTQEETLTEQSSKIDVLSKKTENSVSVKEFGAKGDGITDDTKSIQDTINYASLHGSTIIFPIGTYNISTILPKDGVKGYQSFGATLKAISKAGEGVFASNLSTPANNYFFDGFTIDCNGFGRRGIFINGSNNRITNNTIKGLDNPSNSEQGIRLYRNSSYNVIERNKIVLGVDIPLGTFPSLNGIAIVGNPSSIVGGLDTSNDIVQGTDHCKYNIVRANVIEGGTHGIALNTAECNTISDNTLRNQTHRNIILSPLASYNKINSNECLDFGSAGIHMAYGSSHNLVSGNNIYSSGSLMISSSGGEGAIQSYVHSKNNTILNNKIFTRSTRYGIYSGIHCNGLVISGNVIDGGINACIAVESDWYGENTTELEKFARRNYEPPYNPNWTSWDNGKKFEYVVIKNNTIQRLVSGAKNCGIYIGQSHSAELNNLTIEGNVINSLDSSAEDIYIFVNDSTKFNGCCVRNNNITPLEIMHVVFTNLDTKLLSYEGNNWQKRALTISAATNILDLSRTDNIFISVACTIDTVNGILMDANNSIQRSVTLRLSNGVVLTHDTAKIRLKNSVNVTATSSNQIIKFDCIAGILFEASRNF